MLLAETKAEEDTAGKLLPGGNASRSFGLRRACARCRTWHGDTLQELAESESCKEREPLTLRQIQRTASTNSSKLVMYLARLIATRKKGQARSVFIRHYPRKNCKRRQFGLTVIRSTFPLQ
jgi:hypothetical protein